MTSIESTIDDVEISFSDINEDNSYKLRRVDAEQVRTIGHQANALPMRYQTLHASEKSMRNIAILVQCTAMSIGLLLVEDEDAIPLSEQEQLLISGMIADSRKKKN